MQKLNPEMGVIMQARLAWGRKPGLVVGALGGGILPVLTWYEAHFQAAFWNIHLLLVLGGLTVSAISVFQWMEIMFRNRVKALGWVLIVEGAMTFAPSMVIQFTCLAFLIAVNAAANGCTVALDDERDEAEREKKLEKKLEKRVRSRKRPTQDEVSGTHDIARIA